MERPSLKTIVFLALGAIIFALGVFVAVSPVQTSVGTGCEDGGCSAIIGVTVPALALGSVIIVSGILIFALGIED